MVQVQQINALDRITTAIEHSPIAKHDYLTDPAQQEWMVQPPRG